MPPPLPVVMLVLLAFAQDGARKPPASLADDAMAAFGAPGEAAFNRAMKNLQARPDFSIKALEKALRQGTTWPAAAPKGKVATVKFHSRRYGSGSLNLTSEFPVTCEHVDYSATCMLYVPSTYAPAKAWPLCLVFMGGNSDMAVEDARATTAAYIGPWVDEAERLGIIVAAPVTSVGWSRIGRSLVRAVIREVEKNYRIDPDARSCWGQSMGGHGCWREGLDSPDDWAGVAPVCGGYNYGERLRCLNRLAVFQVWGNEDPHSAGLAGINRQIAEDLRTYGVETAVSVPRNGGHELFEDEIPNLVAYFAKHPRDMYPRTIVGRGGVTCIDSVDPGMAWTERYTWQKPMPWGRYYWTRMTAKRKDAPEGRWEAEIAEGNRIKVRTHGVGELAIYLHDRMLDLEKPVTVVVNGKRAYSGKVRRSAETMMAEVREAGDRGRLYQARLMVKPEGDDAELAPPPAK